jgi:uncharacterized protein YkwD
MRRFIWAGLLLAGFLVLPLGGCNDGDDGSPTREGYCPDTYQQQICDLINGERQDAGLPELQVDIRLADAALVHALDMALFDYMSHTGSDGTNPADRALEAGYEYVAIGENVAAGFPTAAEVVAAWMGSPGHRANILGASFAQLGVGYAFSPVGDYHTYWSTSFGTAVDGGQVPLSGCHP